MEIPDAWCRFSRCKIWSRILAVNRNESTGASDSQPRSPSRPVITCVFDGYKPSIDAEKAVRRILDSVPEKYLLGLAEVVLTNASNLPRKRRRSVTRSRGRKVKQAKARGLYYQAWNGKPAWIEIFVDNTLRMWETGWSRLIPFAQEISLADVLFHEIGHHIHSTARPEFREREDVADVWKVRLTRNYNVRRHPWLHRFLRTFGFGKWIKRLSAKSELDMLQSGWISRAEYEESIRPTDIARESSSGR
jgi:hypothetical protein